MYLIDTDVLSALRGRDRFPRVVEWLANQRTADLCISVVTIGEIEEALRGSGNPIRNSLSGSVNGWTA